MNGTKDVRLEEVDTIIWDFDWTLWGHDNYKELKIICNKLSIPYSDELQQEFFDLLENYEKYLHEKKVTYESMGKCIEYFMPLLELYNISGKCLLETWVQNEETDVIEEARQVVKACAEKGYMQIGFSDWFIEQQMIYLKKFKYLDFFERIFCGNDSYMKPDLKAIDRIIGSRNRKSIVLIGDSLSKDIKISNDSGIYSIWYNWRKEPRSKCPNVVPTYEVTSMLEVLEIL